MLLLADVLILPLLAICIDFFKFNACMMFTSSTIVYLLVKTINGICVYNMCLIMRCLKVLKVPFLETPCISRVICD